MPRSQMVLVALLVVASFLLGSLYTKVRYFEQGAKVTGVAPGQGVPAVKSRYKSFEEAMKAMAKSIKADDKKLLECLSKDQKKAVVDADTAQGNSVGVSGTPAFFVNGRLIPGAVPLEEFKRVIDEELSGKVDKTVTRVTVEVGDAPTKGTPGAPITLIEFSDFQCPFCARAFPTVQQILKEYEGKVLFAYKHFPLISIHPRAQKAAEASECARDQGKFWEFHDKLFEAQEDWASL